MGLFKRGGVWYGRVKNDEGRWVAKTLNTRDPVVARARFQELERREAIPAYRGAHETAFGTAADEFMTSRTVKGCAAGTMHMYDVKVRHLVTFFGEATPLEHVTAPRVDKYIAGRLAAGASRNTIGKELTALRGLLKVAKRAGKFPRALDEVLPIEWSTDYEPRRTALTAAQTKALIAELPGGAEGERGRFVAFVVATGARLFNPHGTLWKPRKSAGHPFG